MVSTSQTLADFLRGDFVLSELTPVYATDGAFALTFCSRLEFIKWFIRYYLLLLVFGCMSLLYYDTLSINMLYQK